MNTMRIIIERPDGTKITIEGPDAERVAKELSPPPVPAIRLDPPAPALPWAPATYPGWPPGVVWTSPSIAQPCAFCGKCGCHETHITCETSAQTAPLDPAVVTRIVNDAMRSGRLS